MGGQPSRSRKLTVDNDDPTNVIKVSDDVVNRIKGSKVRKEVIVPVQEPEVDSNLVVGGTQLCMCQPSLTTLQLQQEHAEDLKKNDSYWQNRIHNLETNHKKMHEVMEVEYKKAVEEQTPKTSENRSGFNLKSEPCQDKKKKVLLCYKQNQTQPMLCANEVKEFVECIDWKRSQILQGLN